MPRIIDDAQFGRLSAWTKHLQRGLQHGSDLRTSVFGPLNRLPVDPQRDVVEERAPVHRSHVDSALDPVHERIQCTYQVVSIDPDVCREVIPRAGGNADEREPVGSGGLSDNRERAVASCHPQCIGAAIHRMAGKRGEILTGGEHDNFDPSLARAVRNLRTLILATAGLRIDE